MNQPRPDYLDPCPPETAAWFNAETHPKMRDGTEAPFTVSMLDVKLADWLDANDPELYEEVHAENVTYSADGPDGQGCYLVEFTRKSGQPVSKLDIHWRGLLEA